MIIYVGDGSNVIKRIRTNHCGGNVEGSALRQHVATALGYKLTRQQRPSGSTRIRIASPNPKEEEKILTKYIRSGSWRFVTCDSAQEALDFQWYVIKQLHPILNVNARTWNPDNHKNYQHLFAQLMNCPQTTFQYLDITLTGPGVYVFYHDQLPDKIHY